MTIFEDYAQYYDALYQDKNYLAECDFLEKVFAAHAGTPVRSILDLGCGTGGHALPLACRGYAVTGVDRSQAMLAEAQRKAEALVRDQGSAAWNFLVGDIRGLVLGQTFDAVIAMFAVMSYMTSNADLLAALSTARRHLRPGGLLVFDAWFGPAVLAERPSDRFKMVQAADERIVRFTSPILDILAHTVQVNYKVWRLQGARLVDEVDEAHIMRYLFPQEIGHYLEDAHFRLLRLCPFMRLGETMTERSWNLSVVAEACEYPLRGVTER